MRKIFTFVFLILCVFITSIVPVSASDSFKVTITGVTDSSNGEASSYSSHTDNSVTFIAGLKLPGDYINYDIKVKNSGSIEAILSKINIEKTDNPAIIFGYQGISEGDILKPGEEITFKVSVAYNSEITTQPDDLTGEIKITLNYEQNGDSGDNNNSGVIDPGDSFDILGVPVPNTVAYVSIYIIIIGLLLIIIAIIVLRKLVHNKKEMATTNGPLLEDNPLKDETLLRENVEVLDLVSNNETAKRAVEILHLDTNKNIEVLDLEPVNETPKEVDKENTSENNKIN